MGALVPGASSWFRLAQPSLITPGAPQLLTRGIEHDQGVFLLLQGLPEVVPRQMQHTGLLLFPGGLWGWGGLGAAGSQGGGDTSSGEAHVQASASTPLLPHTPHTGEHERNPFASFLKLNLKPLFKHEKICTISTDS